MVPAYTTYFANTSTTVDMDAGDIAYINISVYNSTKTIDVIGTASSQIYTSFGMNLMC
jgi:hypothetical protein